ncbi:MAG: hypothetical protein JJU08_13260 [Rhodobacteraceae bacterium]|nr:hypothetical protein [Paracoccaceae bacterium]
MEFDNLVDPSRPYADEIALLKHLLAEQDAALVRKQFSYPLADLFSDFSLFGYRKDASEAERIGAFLNQMSSLSQDTPTSEVLKAAPVLDDWCAIHDCDTLVLIGIVVGHPHIRDRGRARTSLLLQIHPQAGWARTWNRYYRLKSYSRQTFFEWHYESKISPMMQIFEITD